MTYEQRLHCKSSDARFKAQENLARFRELQGEIAAGRVAVLPLRRPKVIRTKNIAVHAPLDRHIRHQAKSAEYRQTGGG